MKKLKLLALVIAILSFAACKKDNPPANNNNNNNTSPYYFTYTLDGATTTLRGKEGVYLSGLLYELGAFQTNDTAIYPNIGFELDWNINDTIKESDMLGLAGKTIYFNDTLIRPTFFYEASAKDVWRSTDTADHNYNIKINSVTYLRNDTSVGYPARQYIINGTCSALIAPVYVQGTPKIITNGSFNFIISRSDL